MDCLPGDMSPQDRDKFSDRWNTYLELSGSPLVRVVGLGRQAEGAGLRVELIALEIREVGAILYWKAYSSAEQMLGNPVIEVSDEVGGEYAVFSGSAGGGGYEWKGETNITPAPQPHAGTLRVTVHWFEAFGHDIPEFAKQVADLARFGKPSPVEGPWVFEFAV